MATEKILLENQRADYDFFAEKISFINADVSRVHKTISDYSLLLDEVFSKIKAVDGISNKTNLLAINASIETIHASDLLASFERIVVDHLRVQGRLIAKLLTFDPDFIMYKDPSEMAKECDIEELYITDEDGIVIFTNVPAWRNTRLASPDIIRILKQPELEVALPAVATGIAEAQFKTVAVGRKDQRGIIQLGAHFTRPKGQLAINGFSVVASEAKRLADEAKNISTKISNLTANLTDEIASLRQLSDAADDYVSSSLDTTQKALSNNELPELSKAEFTEQSKIKLAALNDGLREIRTCFKSVIGPLDVLLNIAKQTNLLGVRAAIEAAHSTNDKADFDALLNRHMTTEAKLASLLLERKQDMTLEEITEICATCGIGETWITNEVGVVELTNVPNGVGFAFLNEGQTAVYMGILSNPNLVVTQPPAKRDLDGKVFKYAACSRRDKPGIFQIGMTSKIYGESTAEGFAVVSKQIKSLAEQSKSITTEITELVEGMDVKAARAIDNIRGIGKHFA